jgi:DNA-directed RNA polymerase subunit RPC12/RpoP
VGKFEIKSQIFENQIELCPERMPNEYKCDACGLAFETGWYHHHQEFRDAMAATLLVCSNCGGQYHLSHRSGGRPDALYTQTRLLSTSKEIACEHELRPFSTRQQTGKMEGLGDPLVLDPVLCSFCNHRGGLTEKWPENVIQCPKCKKLKLHLAGWYIT